VRFRDRLATRPEYSFLQDDLTYLLERVRTIESRFRSSLPLVDTAGTTLESLLPSDWALALVSLSSWIGYALGVSDEVRLQCLTAIEPRWQT
jgi:hypothetical protein